MAEVNLETGPRRILLFAINAAMLMLPLLAVEIPPLVDLPQHMAQATIFREWLSDSNGLYSFHPINPYNLIYVFILGFSVIFPPFIAAKAVVALVIVSMIGSLHWLAARFERAPEAAILASALIFSKPLYWGFLNFLSGWPLFACWIVFVARREIPWRRELIRFVAWLALLFLAHALWFAAAVAWLPVGSWLAGLRRRELGMRCAVMVPAILLAGIWYVAFAATWFATPPLWNDPTITTIFARLSPFWCADAMAGGLRGTYSPTIAAIMAAWIIAAIVQGGRDWNRALLAVALPFVFAPLVLPHRWQNTVFFEQRWAPFGMMLLLLAVPTVRAPRRFLIPITIGVVCCAMFYTSAMWRRFERENSEGFDQVLAVPMAAGPRILELEFRRPREPIATLPLMHWAAWLQVAHGGRLGFSLAEFPVSPVRFREEFRKKPWTGGLEWEAERVKDSDFAHFDYVLVSGDASIQARFLANPKLMAVTTPKPWTLYRVIE